MYFINKSLVISLVIMLAACGENLIPSGEDNRSTVVAGTEGYLPTQKSKDFTLSRTDDQIVTLSNYLETGTDSADAVLIYFTMWCSICAGHTSDIVSTIKPLFADKDLRILIVDYVSGSLADTIIEKENNISDSWGLEVLSDYQNIVKDQLHGSMGVTVVIDGDGTILYNQDYGNGLNVIEALNQAVAS
jgi:hypothetical protein